MKKKVIIITIIIIACLAVVGGVILGLQSMGSGGGKLAKPTGLDVIEFADGTKTIYVNKNSKASSYLFTIQKQNSNITETSIQPNNQFTATALLKETGTYTITCRCLGENDAQKSDAISLTYKSTITLNIPSIAIGTEENTGKILIESNLHYEDSINLKLTLCYTIGTTAQTTDAFVKTYDNNHGYYWGYFDIASIFTQKGQYNLTLVVSAENNEYYLTATSEQFVYIVE